MTDYAMFANGRTFANIRNHELTAMAETFSADELRRMVLGDRVVPLYESSPARGEQELQLLAQFAEDVAHVSFEEFLLLYEAVAGTAPQVLTVTGRMIERSVQGGTELAVPVEAQLLSKPIPASDFLRLRTLNDSVASQFKRLAPLRPIQEVSPNLVDDIRMAADGRKDREDLFRRYSLVAAQNPAMATDLLTAAHRTPREGDMAFLVTRAAMPGVASVDAIGELVHTHEAIARSPEEIKALLLDAELKATAKDSFDAAHAIEATDQLLALLNSGDTVKAIDDFAKFYEFRQLSRAVNQAIELAKRPIPEVPREAVSGNSGGETSDMEAAAALQGLSVEAVMAELPNDYAVDRSTVAAAVAALRAGKHLLLGGPPGTGKTTLAEALCRAVVSTNFDVTTATSDWTTFDTIGGYLPDSSGIAFVPGVVLRSLRKGGWLLIDEVNRADIDKAFGPLFTVLSGGEDSASHSSVLPYTTADGLPVTISWLAKKNSANNVYSITPSWRLIGTLNVSDKASLFRLSFAFLRRFAVIDVPLPEEDAYKALFTRWFANLGEGKATKFTRWIMAIVDLAVPIGPAIGSDFAKLVSEGLTETASGNAPFKSDDEAFLTAARLLVVPQYEGQPLISGNKLLEIVDGLIDGDAPNARIKLETALRDVALS